MQKHIQEELVDDESVEKNKDSGVEAKADKPNLPGRGAGQTVALSGVFRFLPRLPPALIVAAAFFMENLDANIIVTALPAMAVDFAVTPADLSIGITAYLLMLAVFIPLSGWISDRLGARNVFCVAVAVFSLASLLCAVSQSLPQFVVARMLQGAAGALMSPVGRLVVLRATDKRDLIRAIATISWPGLIAPVIAPPLGGLIVTYASWHWIFLLNLPLGILGVLLALRSLPNERQAEMRPFDGRGFVLGALALGCLVLGLDLIGPDSSTWAIAFLVLSAGVVFAVLAVRHARRHPHALFDLDLLRIPTFASASLIGGALTRAAIAGTPFLLPLLFQLGFGLNAFDAGMLLLVYMAGNLAIKPATSFILRRAVR
jgi:EmrB/QacA subfamily drug resistance transporter